mgnify:CR=1 FL=1
MVADTQMILENLTEAVIVLNRDGGINYINNAMSRVSGYDIGDLLNKSLSILYRNQQDMIKSEYELQVAARTGNFVSEGWKTRKDGTRFWGEMNISSIKDASEVVEGYCCTLRDTSAQKEEELQLRQSEERYRIMVEGVKDYSIFMMDAQGYVCTWNDGARLMKGYTANEIIGQHFSIFYTIEDLDRKKAEMEMNIAIRDGRYEEDGWRVRKNGTVFWANVILTPLYNEQNVLIGFSKVTRDLTEKRLHEEALRQSEERYRLLVEQVTDYGIFMLDEKGRIISWNEGAKRIKGYTEAEIVGKYFSIFYPEEDILTGKPKHELKVAREEGKYEEEGWRLKKDGSKFWANVVITAVHSADGTLVGYSKVTRDLTERKNSEKALRESYDRYRMLTEELKVTNSELSYANQELEQFTSIVSHDLQEPVRTIKSFLKLMDLKLDEGELGQLKTYIDKSTNAANRMKELIQNLLQYSQLSKGSLKEQEVNVNDLINDALQNLRASVEISNANIELDLEIEKVYGDRVQLTQLFQNLISNAIKFTDTENPRVRITAQKDNDQVTFGITDNGIGIAEKDLNKVFDIFRRLNTEKAFPGTGIGLAICKKIVERHKGKIWPHSERGKGTTFYFTLQQ